MPGSLLADAVPLVRASFVSGPPDPNPATLHPLLSPGDLTPLLHFHHSIAIAPPLPPSHCYRSTAAPSVPPQVPRRHGTGESGAVRLHRLPWQGRRGSFAGARGDGRHWIGVEQADSSTSRGRFLHAAHPRQPHRPTGVAWGFTVSLQQPSCVVPPMREPCLALTPSRADSTGQGGADAQVARPADCAVAKEAKVGREDACQDGGGFQEHDAVGLQADSQAWRRYRRPSVICCLQWPHPGTWLRLRRKCCSHRRCHCHLTLATFGASLLHPGLSKMTSKRRVQQR